LKQAALVETRKDGLYVHYRLAHQAVSALSGGIRTVAEARLAELDQLVRTHFAARAGSEPVSMNALLKLLRSKSVVVLDTRPAEEYAAGHIAGAISVPVDALQRRLRELPKDKDYVAYCRGPYCVYADRAVELLGKSGRRARRLRDGFPEWKVAGFPIEAHP
jgi:rhodanese-related sulfurtransferase